MAHINDKVKLEARRCIMLSGLAVNQMVHINDKAKLEAGTASFSVV